MRSRRHARANLDIVSYFAVSGSVERRDHPGSHTKSEPATPHGTTEPAPSETSLRSCLYECDVMHHRLEPKEHHFRYRIFMFALDLDEIDLVASKVFGFARNRRALYEFRDRDQLTLPELGEGGTIRDHLTAWLQ